MWKNADQNNSKYGHFTQWKSWTRLTLDQKMLSGLEWTNILSDPQIQKHLIKTVVTFLFPNRINLFEIPLIINGVENTSRITNGTLEVHQ